MKMGELKAIADRYRTEGREPDELAEWKYRNTVLRRRIFDKLNRLKG